jgi:hypothetical protein
MRDADEPIQEPGQGTNEAASHLPEAGMPVWVGAVESPQAMAVIKNCFGRFWITRKQPTTGRLKSGRCWLL